MKISFCIIIKLTMVYNNLFCLIFAAILVLFRSTNCALSETSSTPKPVNGSVRSKFSTPCTTPNHEEAICIGIKSCPILLKELTNPETRKFILESRCGDEDSSSSNNPRVCCGKFGNYKKPSDLVPEYSTTCTTPNNERAKCIGIKSCPILLKQLKNPKSRKFLLQSICEESRGQVEKNPKVCCGKFGNYRKGNTNGLPKNCGTQKISTHRGRILGGKEALLGEFPWMTLLIHKDENGTLTTGCGGSLIHQRFVLTASHCIGNIIVDAIGPVAHVVLGEHNTATEVDCSKGKKICAKPIQIIGVSSTIIHPRYEMDNIQNYHDIGLLHLDRPAQFSDFVRPICLLKERTFKPYVYLASGWGATETGKLSDKKLKVELRPFDFNLCKLKYSLLSFDLISSQICAGGEKNKDTCSGDSGGPLMTTTNGSVWFAAGIVSYGLNCGMEGWPGVYTNVPDYVPWIEEEILKRPNVGNRSKKRTKTKSNKNKH